MDRTDKNFIEKAAKSGMKEQALSQLAAQRATNPQVKQYAQQLVGDHHRVNQELMQLAQSKGVTVDGMMQQHGSSMGMHSTASTSNPTAGSATSGSSSGTTSRTSPSTSGTSTAGTTTGSTASTGAMASTSAAGSMHAIPAAVKEDRDYRKLSEGNGRAFDEQYVKIMVKEHEDAVKLFEDASKNAKDPEIRSFASQHVSALREHLQDARSLERAVAE